MFVEPWVFENAVIKSFGKFRKACLQGYVYAQVDHSQAKITEAVVPISQRIFYAQDAQAGAQFDAGADPDQIVFCLAVSLRNKALIVKDIEHGLRPHHIAHFSIDPA